MSFRAQCRMGHDVLYKKLVAKVASGWDALPDDVGRIVRAKLLAEVDTLVEAHAQTQHQVAELYTQQDELRERMQEKEMELENQRNRGLKARIR